MKKILFLLTLAGSVLVYSAHAQSLKWAYTNDLPDSLTNNSGFVTMTSLNDDAGGSAWLYQSTAMPGIPGFGTSLTRIIWLNKSGKPILTNDVSAADGQGGVSLVRLTRTDLTVQMSGFNAGLFTSTNILRKFTITRTGVTQKDTPLELSERANWATPPIAVNDRTGFFTWNSRLPGSPELVIKRYSK